MKTFTLLDGSFIHAAGTEYKPRFGAQISLFLLQYEDPFVVVGTNGTKLMDAGDYVVYCPATRGMKGVHARHLDEFYVPVVKKHSDAPSGDAVSGRLRKVLEDFTYKSSVGLGQRGLMEHHVRALMTQLAPFIKDEIAYALKTQDEAAAKERKALSDHWHKDAA